MTDSNRVQLAFVREATRGVTPNTPRMRKVRHTSDSLAYRPEFAESAEKRDDRMSADPAKVGEANSGSVNFELSYPVPNSFLAEAIACGMQNDWLDMPARDNDGVADSVITGVAASGGVYTVTAGAAFVAGQIVLCSGFTNAGNNGLKKITTGSTTVPAVGNSVGVVDEASPPATARMKVVGFEGASGDIEAEADGISSTSLDFTTLGLRVGQWLKIGGTGAGYRFATEAVNGWARIIAVAQNKITLDNLPSGWTTDSGASKTIRVFVGDIIRNGVTAFGLTLERGFLGQTVPTYVVQRGMGVNTMQFEMTAKQIVTGSFDWLGMGGAQSTTPLDASPDAAPSPATYRVMTASAHVGRIAEAGALVASPNWVRALSISVNNNLRAQEAIGSAAPVGIGSGRAVIEASAETYFGDNTLYAKLLNAAPTSVNVRLAIDGRALIHTLPRLTAMEGNLSGGEIDRDVMLPLQLRASLDDLTGCQYQIDRFEYFEA